MAEIRLTRAERGQTKVKNVPIAVTPEGFWCCPSPVVFQKSLKAQNPLNKPKPSSPPPKTSVQKKPVPVAVSERRGAAPAPAPSRLMLSDDQQCATAPERPPPTTSVAAERPPRPKIETLPKKVAIEFGEPGTCDMKVVLLGKQGFSVKLSVHKDVLTEKSSFFSEKLSEQSSLTCLQIGDCEDVEIYIETVGLMYCKEMKQRLMKQSVSRILRILKVAEFLGFSSCIQSCLEYLEAVPWVGEEEEEKVVSTVLQLQAEGIGVNPVLKRVSSDISNVPKDTLSHIIELVLKSNEERGRREMKLIVLKLLRENNRLPSYARSSDICNDRIYRSCKTCLDSLLSLFKKAAEPAFADKPSDDRDHVTKHIALEADNLSWLLEILIDKQAADEFALMWANQQELAFLHEKLPIVSRYHVSCISGRLYVGIGRGELLPSKDTRQLLLQTWLQPLMNDYNWLQHGCRSFDRKLVEEGIGRTILTLPLEDQQSILLSWLGSFLKTGDSCPNLQRAFEVWWRRTFIRPYVENQGNVAVSDSSISMLPKQHE
ncbi:BTB/POZ domain-containing protein At3g50780-like [Abrus precatorius]|uniref:BTB/POZ domain-containing protein At3g50780-like n=1 Tax=Abrus precatorius TaxID=3816 RepID=A0A8B8KU71_ABRPR|nr:BTB/POZ domain-containing protein At3g50780-like [Abrus precatorius]XP_027346129.1 BTB/POZ domain-containing protein At3g50780-like [Abrus precatorius]